MKDAGSRITHSFIAPWQIAGWVPKGNVCALCSSKIDNREPREESVINEDCFNRLKPEDKRTIVLQSNPAGLTYDFHSFYKEISHLIDHQVNFSFIETFETIKKWRKRGFSRIPTSGTLVVEYYRKVYGNVNIVGFGHGSNGKQDKFYHYWDIKKDKSLSNDPHNINTDIIWLNRLHRKNKINILELDESNNTI